MDEVDGMVSEKHSMLVVSIDYGAIKADIPTQFSSIGNLWSFVFTYNRQRDSLLEVYLEIRALQNEAFCKFYLDLNLQGHLLHAVKRSDTVDIYIYMYV